jgi:hypothetical protein
MSGVLTDDDYLLSWSNVVAGRPLYFVINAEMLSKVALFGGKAVASAHTVILNEARQKSESSHPLGDGCAEIENCKSAISYACQFNGDCARTLLALFEIEQRNSVSNTEENNRDKKR